MFFSRNKQTERVELKDEATGLTPGVAENVAAFIQHNRDTAAGKNPEPIFTADAPLQLLTTADVEYFVAAMEAEAARIDDEAAELSRQRLADIAAKDAQIAALKREIENTKAKTQAQDAEITRRVADRLDLLEKVKKVDPNLVTDKLTEDQIRTEVVKAKFGTEAVAGKLQSYIDARFDFIVDSTNTDAFRSVMHGRPQAQSDVQKCDQAYKQMCDELTNGWKH